MNDDILLEVCRFNPTPFYLFDLGALSNRIESIRKYLPARTKLCYAMKANPFVAAEVASMVERVEVCSPGEYEICQRLNVSSKQVVFSGVWKDFKTVERLVCCDASIGRFTVESEAQFQLLKMVSDGYDTSLDLLIRVSSGNQFGVDEKTALRLARECQLSDRLRLQGIQFFSGTQKVSPKRIRREIAYLDGLMAAIAKVLGTPALELEYGPGLPVEYYVCGEMDYDRVMLRALADSLREMRFRGEVVLELGRSIAAACGVYVTSIVDTKTTNDQQYAIVDGGRHQVAYFGNAMAMRQLFCWQLFQRQGGEVLPWTICGSLCTANDILVKQMPLCSPLPGDILVFPNAGAYCMTEGLSLFLSRDLPRVVIRSEDGTLRTARDRMETAFLNVPVY